MRLLGPIPAAVAVVVLLCAGAGAVRWAKQHSTGAQVMACAMLLVLGLTVPIIDPPQQRIEAVRQDKGKKGAEPGPPLDEPGSSGG